MSADQWQLKTGGLPWKPPPLDVGQNRGSRWWPVTEKKMRWGPAIIGGISGDQRRSYVPGCTLIYRVEKPMEKLWRLHTAISLAAQCAWLTGGTAQVNIYTLHQLTPSVSSTFCHYLPFCWNCLRSVSSLCGRSSVKVTHYATTPLTSQTSDGKLGDEILRHHGGHAEREHRALDPTLEVHTESSGEDHEEELDDDDVSRPVGRIDDFVSK
ncbi:uncharacterized protein LOC130274526 [Hyla sarda]|uniref:uncharacterized protein LOC130274526 n=1 Tax=Hyla sarda TaxID=327740 RepID=UPI0024C3B0FB|nr:uncharacterized protein LOC130274526 [Hyla sarda]